MFTCVYMCVYVSISLPSVHVWERWAQGLHSGHRLWVLLGFTTLIFDQRFNWYLRIIN